MAVALEVVRLVVGVEWVVYEKLTREYERDNPAGYALYVFSGSVTGLLFGPEIAVPAMLMLTLADPIAGLLSSNELRTVKQGRVLATMFAVSAALAVPFVSLPAAVLGGLAAMLADGVKPVIRGVVVDDNLSIPIVAAVAMFVGVTYLPTVGV
jgi:dolichol kinase